MARDRRGMGWWEVLVGEGRGRRLGGSEEGGKGGGWTVNSGGIGIALREGGELRVDGFGCFGYT